MAYAILANLEPIIGIYMAFFPVIVYSIMGTSRHISLGTCIFFILYNATYVCYQYFHNLFDFTFCRDFRRDLSNDRLVIKHLF